jgi:hypothetical protein
VLHGTSEVGDLLGFQRGKYFYEISEIDNFLRFSARKMLHEISGVDDLLGFKRGQCFIKFLELMISGFKRG